LRSKKKKTLTIKSEAKQSLTATYKGLKSLILPLKSHPQPTRNSCDRSTGQEKGSNSSNGGIHMHSLFHLQMPGRLKGYLPTITWPWFSVTKCHVTSHNGTKFSPKVQYTLEIYIAEHGGWGGMAHDAAFPLGNMFSNSPYYLSS